MFGFHFKFRVITRGYTKTNEQIVRAKAKAGLYANLRGEREN